MDDVYDVDILDDACNMSDHMPVVLPLALQRFADNSFKCNNNFQFSRPRWDKADLVSYYNCSNQLLSAISVPLFLLDDTDCMDADVGKCYIEPFYSNSCRLHCT